MAGRWRVGNEQVSNRVTDTTIDPKILDPKNLDYKSKHISPHGEDDQPEEPKIEPEKDPPPPPKPKPKTFKQWTREDFAAEVTKANHDDLLYPEEVEDFLAYWMEKSATGRSKLSMEKTWDTRRRMQTAVKVVFEAKRKNSNRTVPLLSKAGQATADASEEWLRRRKEARDKGGRTG